jgi:hypothetical protein
LFLIYGHMKFQHVPENCLSNGPRSQEEATCAPNLPFYRITVTRRGILCPKTVFQSNHGHKKRHLVPENCLSIESRSQVEATCAPNLPFNRITVTRRANMCPKTGSHSYYGHKHRLSEVLTFSSVKIKVLVNSVNVCKYRCQDTC